MPRLELGDIARVCREGKDLGVRWEGNTGVEGSYSSRSDDKTPSHSPTYPCSTRSPRQTCSPRADGGTPQPPSLTRTLPAVRDPHQGHIFVILTLSSRLWKSPMSRWIERWPIAPLLSPNSCIHNLAFETMLPWGAGRDGAVCIVCIVDSGSWC